MRSNSDILKIVHPEHGFIACESDKEFEECDRLVAIGLLIKQRFAIDNEEPFIYKFELTPAGMVARSCA